jgi:penicillin-binding protein 1A
VYAAALEQNISPCEPIPNQKVTWHKYDTTWSKKDWSRRDPKPNIDKETGKDLNDWSPDNVDGRYGGYYSMEGALSNSVNVATVHMIMRIGVWPVLKMARLLGIESPIPPEPSVALGSADLSLLEMVSAFGTFPNRGRHATPLFITRIEKADGTVLAEFKPPPANNMPKALSPDNADAMTRLLQAVTDGGTAGSLRWKYKIPSDMAGKTGTSQNHSDGWFIGFTPHLVAGAYVGAQSPAVRFRDLRYGQGSFTALPIWGLFMSNTLSDTSFSSWADAKFEVPAQHVLDSLKCSHRPWPKLTDEELEAIRNRVLVDSLGNPIIGDPEKSELPELPTLDIVPPKPKENGR